MQESMKHFEQMEPQGSANQKGLSNGFQELALRPLLVLWKQVEISSEDSITPL